jgi:hypothetical protein
MVKTLFLGFFLTVFGTYGFDSPAWHEGMIVMKDGQVHRGKLAIHSFELALFKTQTGLEAFSPQKVKAVYYFDPHYNFYRKFVSVDMRWGRPARFYEVVVNGKLGIVRKLRAPYVSCDKRSDKNDYDYYLKQGSKLVSLKDFKQVYKNIADHNPLLAQEVKLKKLNPAVEADAIRIVQLLNDVQLTALSNN